MKKPVALLLAIVLIFSITACKSASPAETASTTESAAATDPVHLEVFLMCPDFYDAAVEMVNTFSSLHDNVTAELSQLTTASCAEALQPRAAAGNLPDVMSIDGDSFGAKLADEGLLVNINNYPNIKNNIIPALIGPYTSPGGVFFGVAGGLAAVIMYYNKDLFNQAGITENDFPSDFRELLTLLGKLKDAGITPLIVPSSIVLSSMPNTFFSTGMVTNFGDIDYPSMIQAGDFDFTDQRFVNIFEKVQEINDLGYFIRGITSLEYSAGNDAFMQGEGAITFAGNWLAGPFFGNPNFEVGVFQPTLNEPGQKPGFPVGPETGFAAANNANAEWSAKFLDFMVNGEGFYIYQNARGNQPFIVNFDASRVMLDEQLSALMSKIFADPNVNFAPFWMSYMPSEMAGEIPMSFTQILSGELTPVEVANNFNEAFQLTVN